MHYSNVLNNISCLYLRKKITNVSSGDSMSEYKNRKSQMLVYGSLASDHILDVSMPLK